MNRLSKLWIFVPLAAICFAYWPLDKPGTLSKMIVGPIKEKSSLERNLVTIHQSHPLIIGYGRDIYLNAIRIGKAEAYELTYEDLPGSDCLQPPCAEAFIVYIGKDKRFHRLNLCPVSMADSSFAIRKGSKCLSAFNTFLKLEGLSCRLGKQELAMAFITLCCHVRCGDYPELLLSENNILHPKALTEEQEAALKQAKKFGIKAGDRGYSMVVKYGRYYASNLTAKAVKSKWWYPLVMYRFSLDASGKVVSVRGTILNGL